jgi:hypothetical protein
MESKKKNTGNQKQSFALLTVLSLCAIVTSTATAAIEQQSKNQNFAPATEQQSQSQDSVNHLEQNNSAVLEEIDLDKEWEGISSDKSEEVFLARGI